MKSLKAFWELTRLEHGLIYGLGVIAGAYISLHQIVPDLFILGFFTALFLQASAFALNDYFDYDVDIANRRFDRPLVRGELKRESALYISILLAFPGFVSAYLISFEAFLLALIITLAGYIYDIKLKEYGVAGNAYIAFSMSAPFIFGSVVAGNITPEVILLSLIAFLSGMAREIMKGIEDVEGDELRNVRTVARIYGEEKAGKISALLFTTAVFMSLITPAIPEYLDIKYLVPVAFCDYILIKTSFKLYSGVERKDIKDLRKKTMVAMFFGLIGFLIGSS